MTIAEEKAMAYADRKLKVADPKLAESGYQRHTKMRVNMFSGGDVEEAYQDGYEQGEQDLADRLPKWKKVKCVMIEFNYGEAIVKRKSGKIESSKYAYCDDYYLDPQDLDYFEMEE